MVTSFGPGHSTENRPSASVETRAESPPASTETVAFATGAPPASRTVPSKRTGEAAATDAAKSSVAMVLIGAMLP